ncbi:S49 family peptidase [Modicisalibacter radicis]|uniref:S49 family peptidase n=1 Tax=Halomonas sp. EAR18 TaxID=2518972 RepID=UPI00109D08D6|nr:S49 family peptidase [Halomonas sp. EAR18]
MPQSALNLLASRNWLITTDGLDTIMAVADRQGDVKALEARLGRPLDNTRSVSVRDGVAVVPITGPIFRYANLFTEISGAVSTEMLVKDIQAALDDPSISSIVLNIDSPGGEATGINELSDLIYNARGRKPIKAYVGGQMASALYWIGSAADEVIADDTAQLGSVGVVLSLRKRDDMPGEKTFEIVSSNAPNKRPDPETEAGRAQLQARTDELASVFLDKVARNRGIPRDQVNDRFRQGGIATGALAVKAGMADRLGSLESLIAELAGNSSSTNTQHRTISMTTVRTTDEFQAAIAAGVDPRKIKVATQVDVDTERAQAYSQASQAAVLQERRRCHEIWNLAGKDHRDIAIQAIDSGMSVEALGLELFQARQEKEQRDSAVCAISGRWQSEASRTTQHDASESPRQPATVTAITDHFRRR